MMKQLNLFHPALIAVCLLSQADAALSQSVRGVRSYYDRGAQAYFAGRSIEAEALLSEAMGQDPDDPRPYYFRALTLLRQGRTLEARGDMMLGAALESKSPDRYLVGMALQRVQGAARLELEKFRREGRAASMATRAQEHRGRQQQISTQDSQVLREPVVIPLDELLRSDGPRALSAQELARRAAAAAEAARVPSRLGGPSAQPPLEDPFREDSTAAAAATTLPAPPAAPVLPPKPSDLDVEATAEPPAAPADDNDSSEDPFDIGT